jgi:hypothetical protein
MSLAPKHKQIKMSKKKTIVDPETKQYKALIREFESGDQLSTRQGPKVYNIPDGVDPVAHYNLALDYMTKEEYHIRYDKSVSLSSTTNQPPNDPDDMITESIDNVDNPASAKEDDHGVFSYDPLLDDPPQKKRLFGTLHKEKSGGIVPIPKKKKTLASSFFADQTPKEGI